jgi:c-di-GMP-binding flagellar brake protein YcgR
MPKDDVPASVFQEKKNGTSEDISISGIQLICEERIPVDQIVRLDIVINETQEPLATFAEVRWIREDSGIKKFRVGMEFLVIKEDHIEAIKKIIG